MQGWLRARLCVISTEIKNNVCGGHFSAFRVPFSVLIIPLPVFTSRSLRHLDATRYFIKEIWVTLRVTQLTNDRQPFGKSLAGKVIKGEAREE